MFDGVYTFFRMVYVVSLKASLISRLLFEIIFGYYYFF